jgi:acetyl-CoA synthetase
LSATHEIAWRPPLDGSTNVERFCAAHGIDGFDALLERSLSDPAWFWDAVVRFLGIPFAAPYDQVVDVSDGVPWAQWFMGGTLNLAGACVDRWSDDPASADREAIVWEGEDGRTVTWTYAELRRHVDALARVLSEHGVGEGDAVGIFLPMIPEVVAACMAIAKLGAIFLPIFSGYGADAIAVRLEDANAKAIITASHARRRGKAIDMESTARRAVAATPSVEHVLVVTEPGTGWASDDRTEPLATQMLPSETPLFVAYTSGTTGRPKGSVHVHGGFTVKIAEEAAFQFDVRPGDRLFWFADFGWIMGPWEIVGALANGATVCLYDGAPDWPEPDRLWAYIERHAVTVLGISPTLIRSVMAGGEAPVRAHDLSSLRILGSTGEPWNEDPWRWYFEVVGRGRCPIINISGGTEVGACFLSPHPVQALTPMTLGGPALGMAVDVFDDAGCPVREQVGELVCTQPWPGMTRGLWHDPDRYLETYWSRWPDVWVHGDWASIEDGRWYLHGRSDDTIKIAGKRLGPAEAESALVSHPAVVEAAAVGMPNEVKGEELWGFVVLADDAAPTDALRSELAALVAERLGKSFKPAAIRFTRSLPKTRSAKVLRRAIRATALGIDPGDLSSLEDAATIDAIREAV